jgi:ATP phosphoribosyltransferase
MADLDDVAAEYRRRHGRRLRVATKYFNLTRRFFSRHGIADYLLVESLGATEGTPAAGSADLIVDITTTGATLAANGLRTLDDGLILRSEAFLVASLAAPWGAAARGAVRTILDRIEAEAAGRTLRELRADIAGTTGVVRQASDRFGARNPFAGGAVDGGKSPPSGPLVLHCPAEHVEACADWLRAEAGATTVVVSRIETVFSASSPVHDRLLARIGGGG